MVFMLEIFNGLMPGRGLRRAFAPSALRTLLFCFLLSGFWLPSSAYAQYYIYTAPKDQPPFLNTGNFPCNTTRTEGSIRFVTSSLTFEGCNGTTWSALGGSGGGPIGSTTQIAFNSGGTETGSADLIWNSSTSALTVTGDINYSGIITDTSDIRLKRDIRPLSESGDMLARLMRVGTYSYIRKNNRDNRVEYGVLAQQVQSEFPDLVFTANDAMGTKSVNYDGLIPPLIASVQELKRQNDHLRLELESMMALIGLLLAVRMLPGRRLKTGPRPSINRLIS
jgi:Chaperone of endosialidase